MKDGFLEIGDLLHAVIMGCEMPCEEEGLIRELLKDHGQHVRLKRVSSCSTQILSDTGECGLV